MTNLNKLIELHNIQLTNTLKLLLFKTNEELFEKLNFDNDDSFLEPLLFAYFYSRKNDVELLYEILQGYFKNNQELKTLKSINNSKIAYIPKVGYFKNEHKFFSINFIYDSKIEVLRYPHPLMNNIYPFEKIKSNGKTTILDDFTYRRCLKILNNAFKFIRESSPNHYYNIIKTCKKIFVFNECPNKTNSFATINAHGIAFINIYQKYYDEVFLVDDIAHQTGHIILTTILFDRKRFFLIDENINIGAITNNASEYRNFYTLFHALFTYYTSLMCLDNCINGNCFDKKQTYEAEGRIGFYLNKLILDTNNFNVVVDHYSGIEHLLTEEGIKIYEMIEIKFSEIIAKWYHITKAFNYQNQPYNFTYQQFIKLNPMSNA